jgi:hypothetical protein
MIDETKELITSVRKNELEFPSEVSVSYSNVDNDYQIGTEYARRLTATHENKVAISLPIALTSSEAAKIADIALNSAWYSGRYSYSFSTTYVHLKLSPGDLITIPLNTGRTELVKITSIEYVPTGLINYEAVPEIPSLYNSLVSGNNTTYTPTTLTIAGPSILSMLDCCILRDEDNSLGWYYGIGGYSTGWAGATLFKSLDGGATYLTSGYVPSLLATHTGSTSNALPSGSTTCWDNINTLTVSMNTGSLSSATDLAVLGGANSILVGAPGRWELVQFRTATPGASAGSYTLSGLLRGRKGTEWAVGTHQATDTVVLLGATINNLIVPSAELNSSIAYKCVPVGESLEGSATVNKTYVGERLRPLTPINISAYRTATTGAYDIIIKWVRRDRINAGWNDYSDIPQSEVVDKWRIEFFKTNAFDTIANNRTDFYNTNSTTLDALVSGSPNFTIVGDGSYKYNYTSASQLIDGSQKITIYIRISQVSATVGFGRFQDIMLTVA